MQRPILALLFIAAAIGRLSAQGADVIVVGAGPGGLATALEAATGGARVTVIDVASVFGGHAVVSEGGLSFAGTPLQREPVPPR
ncbi:MAG: FAD-binding protein [Vicinamibacteria bacterium]|nr:FAD-binding protein [Vicinamibacteria bacterium]